MLTWVSSHGGPDELAGEGSPNRRLARGLDDEVHTGEDDAHEYTYNKVPSTHRHDDHDDLADD